MILFNHLHKTGGLTVCHHLRELFSNHFQIDPRNPNRSIREFASMPESQRRGFDLVCGHRAITLRNWANPKLSPMTVLRDPVERVLSLYRFCRMHRQETWHLLCKSKPIGWCCENIGEFSNYYAKNFVESKYRYVFTSADAMIRSAGYQGVIQRINASDPVEFTDEDREAVKVANLQDIAIWESIRSRSKGGFAVIS